MLPVERAKKLVVSESAQWEGSGTIALPSSRPLRARLLYVGEDNYVLGASDLLPIRVNISLDDGGSYVVASPDTGIFGVARTLAHALRDFRSALQDHYEVLEEDEAELAPHLAEQLQFLKNHLRRS